MQVKNEKPPPINCPPGLGSVARFLSIECCRDISTSGMGHRYDTCQKRPSIGRIAVGRACDCPFAIAEVVPGEVPCRAYLEPAAKLRAANDAHDVVILPWLLTEILPGSTITNSITSLVLCHRTLPSGTRLHLYRIILGGTKRQVALDREVTATHAHCPQGSILERSRALICGSPDTTTPSPTKALAL